MARGWESKAVADQIEEGEERAPDRAPDVDRSPEGRQKREHVASLMLSRSRTLSQLERATNAPYRQMLEKALQKLEQELEELSR